jgi:hypothetical protein
MEAEDTMTKCVIAIGELNGETLTVEVDFEVEIAKIMGWELPTRGAEAK